MKSRESELINFVIFQVGDRVGVGCIVDSCRDCAQCAKGNEQYCGKGMVGTYNSKVLLLDVAKWLYNPNLLSALYRLRGTDELGRGRSFFLGRMRK
jgi:hypothetical protein